MEDQDLQQNSAEQDFLNEPVEDEVLDPIEVEED